MQAYLEPDIRFCYAKEKKGFFDCLDCEVALNFFPKKAKYLYGSTCLGGSKGTSDCKLTAQDAMPSFGRAYSQKNCSVAACALQKLFPVQRLRNQDGILGISETRPGLSE